MYIGLRKFIPKKNNQSRKAIRSQKRAYWVSVTLFMAWLFKVYATDKIWIILIHKHYTLSYNRQLTNIILMLHHVTVPFMLPFFFINFYTNVHVTSCYQLFYRK